MKKDEVLRAVRQYSRINTIALREVDKIINAFLRVVRETVAEQGLFRIQRIGTFRVKMRRGRTGVDIKGNKWSVPDRKIILFKPSRMFLDQVRQELNDNAG